MKLPFASIAAFVLLFSACTSTPQPIASGHNGAGTPTPPNLAAKACTKDQPLQLGEEKISIDAMDVAHSSNLFGWRLFLEIGKKQEGNYMISPYSVSAAFSMLFLASAGTTTAEMQTVFNWQNAGRAQQEGFAALRELVQGNAKKSGYQIAVANNIWADVANFCIYKSFAEAVQKYHAAVPQSIDFKQTKKAVEIIDKWTQENTGDKIKTLFTEEQLQNMVVALANAIYFKADWANAFQKEATQEKPFFGKEQKNMSFMSGKFPLYEAGTRYATQKDFAMLRLPYKVAKTGEQGASMYIILPNEKVSLQQLYGSLSADVVSALPQAGSSTDFDEVYVELPKWTAEFSADITQTLKAMGLQTTIENPDFSKMSEAGSLRIGVVVHKTFVAVDEQGTEAAAVTGIGMTKQSAPMRLRQAQFIANRPFLYLIVDDMSGCILFMGQVVQ